MSYKSHPYAELFPMLGAKELKDLAEDIRENGQRDPIVLVGDTFILDGRNRFQACMMAEVEPTFESFHGDDREKLAFVISKNFKRRHLDESQRARVADKIATAKRGAPEGNANNHEKSNAQECAFDSTPPVTQTEAAEMMSVSRRLVQAAHAIEEHGDDDLKAAVDAGEVTVTDAASIVSQPKSVQKKAVKAKRAGKAKTVKKAAAEIAPPPNPETATPDPVVDRAALKKRREELFKQLAEVDEQLAEAGPPKGKTLKDSQGNLVPERLFKVFHAAEHFIVARKAYGALSDALTLAHRELPKGLIDPKEIDGLLRELYRKIEAAEPHIVCPKCMGDGFSEKQTCKPCGGYGFTRTGGQRS